MSTFILALLGAFLWRLRGGLLNDLTGRENYPVLGIPFNDTVVRIIWSVGMAAAFWMLHPSANWLGKELILKHQLPVWGGFIVLGLALFADTTDVGWFGAALLPTRWRDVGLLSFSGFLRSVAVAAALTSGWPLLAGLLFGPAYWLGSKIPRWRPWMVWGEIICGAVFGVVAFR